MNIRRIFAAAVMMGTVSVAMGDGMIVPTHPDIAVRGHWAVRYHRVNIKVRDQVASVHIDQEFVNIGRGMIEVEYLFPVPPDAAIDSMTMIVDGKEYAARLLNADEARNVYEEIVRKKKDPALLEYAGFGLYRTRAFPLTPGKPCKVVVTYKNLCPRDNKLVEVWYPLNTEKFSAKAIEDVSVKVDIRNDRSDIAAVYSPTHDLTVDRRKTNHVVATFSAKNVIPQTDFQVFYKATNEKVAATLLTHMASGDADGYFMLLAAPSPRKPDRKPMDKDVLVVLDRSGSMSGKKIEQAVESAKFIVNNLNPGDRFNVITYSDSVEKIFDSLVAAGRDNIKEARRRLGDVQATGGTDIHSALGEAMDVLDKKADGDADRPAYVIFLTDGKPTVGNTNEKDIIADTQKANRSGARMFVFGVGYDVNVRLLDRLAIENRGRSDYVKPNEPIESKISALYRKIKNPVMTDLAVKVPGVRLFNVYPREIPDLFEGDQIVLFGRYDGKDAAGLPVEVAGGGQGQLLITGEYLGAKKSFEYPAALRTRPNKPSNVFIERLWAMRRVGYLLDEVQLHGRSDEVVDEITRLGKKYGIMTPYTSFLADETTALHSEAEVHKKADEVAYKLAGTISGAGGQMAAGTRQQLKEARNAPAPTDADAGSSVMQGNTNREDYEAGRTETVANVRQVGNQGIYRRGDNVWIASNATDVDPEKDEDKIRDVNRFSEEYFELVRKNTVEQNQVLSSQRGDEELLIRLRGQVYRIK